MDEQIPAELEYSIGFFEEAAMNWMNLFPENELARLTLTEDPLPLIREAIAKSLVAMAKDVYVTRANRNSSSVTIESVTDPSQTAQLEIRMHWAAEFALATPDEVSEILGPDIATLIANRTACLLLLPCLTEIDESQSHSEVKRLDLMTRGLDSFYDLRQLGRTGYQKVMDFIGWPRGARYPLHPLYESHYAGEAYGIGVKYAYILF